MKTFCGTVEESIRFVDLQKDTPMVVAYTEEGGRKIASVVAKGCAYS